MILVVGGTGRLGSLVANRLAARGQQVRVVSRGLTPAAVPLDGHVERVLGDVRHATRIRELVASADVVVLAMHGFLGPGRVSPRSVDDQGSRNIIAAAEQVDADVVLLSIAGASVTNPLELARVKYDVEEHLRTARCRWTVVRPDAFAQTWLDMLEQTAAKSHRPVVFGNGDNPFGFVDVHEVAALVEYAVLEPSLRGRTMEISGPERLTLQQLAALVMEQHGWPGKPRRVPRLALRLMATFAAPIRPDLARQARACLAMDVLGTVDDHETRAAFPDLPALPVSRLVRHTV
jgi:uncharacterized protein YbjT (DUF2867 family)